MVAPSAGFLLDRFGLTYGLYLSIAALVTSQASLLLAVNHHSFLLAVMAKMLGGLGFDPLAIVKQLILASWFFGKELSFATNMHHAICRDITFVTGLVTPTVVDDYGMEVGLEVGLVIGLVSFASTGIILKVH
jgi:MFS family permease